jgi:hypothetical protein
MATKSKQSVIGSVTKTLVGSQGGKVKHQAIITEAQLVEMGASLGNAYCAFTSASDALEAVRLEIVKTGFKPIDLRTAKSNPEGAKQTQIFKSAFIDTVIASGKTAKVAQNYFEIVAKGLTSGKPITSTNPAMTKKAKGKGKGGSKAGGDALAIALKLYQADSEKFFSAEFIAELDEVLSKAGLLENEA